MKFFCSSTPAQNIRNYSLIYTDDKTKYIYAKFDDKLICSEYNVTLQLSKENMSVNILCSGSTRVLLNGKSLTLETTFSRVIMSEIPKENIIKNIDINMLGSFGFNTNISSIISIITNSTVEESQEKYINYLTSQITKMIDKTVKKPYTSNHEENFNKSNIRPKLCKCKKHLQTRYMIRTIAQSKCHSSARMPGNIEEYINDSSMFNKTIQPVKKYTTGLKRTDTHSSSIGNLFSPRLIPIDTMGNPTLTIDMNLLTPEKQSKESIIPFTPKKSKRIEVNASTSSKRSR